jgi:hypothetical protein
MAADVAPLKDGSHGETVSEEESLGRTYGEELCKRIQLLQLLCNCAHIARHKLELWKRTQVGDTPQNKSFKK